MKTSFFRVSTIIDGKYWPAFQPVPDHLVFSALRQYQIDGPPKPTALQKSIDRELMEQNYLPPDLQAMVDDESRRMQENPVVKAKIVEKGANYNTPLSPELQAELDAMPASRIYSPDVPEEDEEEPEPEPKPRKPKHKPAKPAIRAQRYVRRRSAFVPIGDSTQLIAGEKLYIRQKGVVPPRFMFSGRVKEEET